ncbi:hypothetical protein ABK040_004085 [Willaertia magna]
MSIHGLTLYQSKTATNNIKTYNPCDLKYNEPFTLILKRNYRNYNNQEALLIKNNIKITDVKLSNYYCVLLDEFGKVYVMSCYLDDNNSIGIDDKFFCNSDNGEDFNSEIKKKENEFKLLNFTKEDPIQKIFAKFSPIFVLLSKKGNVYLFGASEKYNIYLNENNTIKKELLNGERIVEVACGYAHILLLTESGKIFGFGDNYYGQLGVKEDYSNVGNYKDIKFRISETSHISSKIRKVYATYNTSFALTEDGELYGCGSTDYGASGVKICLDREKFTKIDIKEKVIEVYNGYFFVAVKTINSKFYVFGYNNAFQFGESQSFPNGIINGPHLLDTFDNNEIEEMECGGYGTIIVTKNRKIHASGDFGQVFLETVDYFNEIDLKKHLGNHQVFSNQNFKLKVRAACNFVVFFTVSSKIISEIFNFKNIWKIYDIDVKFL